jgi:hypothetical protein
MLALSIQINTVHRPRLGRIWKRLSKSCLVLVPATRLKLGFCVSTIFALLAQTTSATNSLDLRGILGSSLYISATHPHARHAGLPITVEHRFKPGRTSMQPSRPLLPQRKIVQSPARYPLVPRIDSLMSLVVLFAPCP